MDMTLLALLDTATQSIIGQILLSEGIEITSATPSIGQIAPTKRSTDLFAKGLVHANCDTLLRSTATNRIWRSLVHHERVPSSPAILPG
jgi:hypothetical protein